MEYEVTNLHSVYRSYKADNGKSVGFAPGETKTLATKPPRNQGAWKVEGLEQTAKPEDIETKQGGE